MTAFFRSRATGRNLLFSLGLVLLLTAILRLVLFPIYREVSSGFDPMDVQFPLTREMVAFQRGAFSPGIAGAYLQVATIDCIYPIARALFTVLLWCWLAARGPNAIAENALRFGIIYVPWLAALADLAENIGFLRLIFANPRDPLHEITGLTLAIHTTKYVLMTVTNAFTVGLVAAAAASRIGALRRKA